MIRIVAILKETADGIVIREVLHSHGTVLELSINL